jgi:predicted glycogen debranching enzyme
MLSVDCRLLAYEDAKSREWLVSNGIGGYASSTVTGANTRKYHGLLVASRNPPVERRLLLSKLEETAKMGSEQFPLSTNKYAGAIFPKGYERLLQFFYNPLPTFEFAAGGARIAKTVFMVHGKNTVIVKYAVESASPVEITIAPLANERDFHSNSQYERAFLQNAQKNSTSLLNDGKPFLFLSSDKCTYAKQENYYKNMLYDLETERGEADTDTHFSPGVFTFRGTGTFFIVASDERFSGDASSLYKEELIRLRGIRERTPAPVPDELAYSADTFLATRKSTASGTIIAGYHWFADWGRDSMIALPGLALSTKRYDFAKSVLGTFAGKIKNGLVPNVFSDSGDGASYNSVDSSLWFVDSSYKYLKKTKDEAFFKEVLFGKIKGIIESYKRGTSGVRMDSDGLLICEPGLTWMDAFVDGKPVTPRGGKIVEINALWFNALEIARSCAEKFEDKEYAARAREDSKKVKQSFSKFFNSGAGCLFDSIEPFDSTVRPNQVFAISLPFTMLDTAKEKLVLGAITQELATPYGLRSLSPKDRKYCGGYSGDRKSRDYCYHNGPVWSFLLGPYADARAKLISKDSARELVQPLKEFIGEKGMGTVPELFEGNSLKPAGCFSQAWGVSEWLRVISEYGK